MSYYEEVFLKRVNLFGTSRQERIKNKMRHDFENSYLQRTINQVTVEVNDEILLGALVPNKQDEAETTCFILVPSNIEWPTGTILKADGDKWLVLHLQKYINKGYNKYKVIRLKRQITWVNDDKTLSTADVFLTGELDKSIKNDFKIQYGIAAGLYKPVKILNVIMAADNNLKRTIDIKIEDDAWRVSGIDKISVPGVFYVTLEEILPQKEDIDFADEYVVDDWEIISTLGETIHLKNGTSSLLDFLTFYISDKEKQKVTVSIDDETIATYNDGTINALKNGSATMTVVMDEIKYVKKDFTITVDDNEQMFYTIIGPSEMREVDTVTYEFRTNDSSVKYDFEIDGLLLKNQTENTITVYANSMGLGMIKVVDRDSGAVLTSKNVSIRNMWVGG